jgi:hypothetical protein
MKYLKIMMAVAALALATKSAHAQYSQYGAIENFYQANPDMNTGQYAGRVVNPAYWLVDWNRWDEMDSRLTGDGFVRLGTSSWESNNAIGGGVPQKFVALDYAKAIGADVIIYAVHSSTDKYDWTSHDVAFYAKQSVRRATPARRPTSAEATVAINRFQDAHGEPRLQGGVTYDAQSDTYNWIGQKTRRTMSKSADWFLDHFGAYL